MKEEKNIFELFQTNESAWDEMPSSKAWERLEQKLDMHKRKARVVHFRRLAIAASFLLVLGAASVMTLQSQQAQKAQFAMNDYQTDDLEAAYFSDAPSYEPLRYAKGSVINEGSPTSKLVAAVNYFYTDEVQAASEDMSHLVLDTVKNVMQKILPSRRDFTWLLGDWVGKTANGTSVEQWKNVEEDVYDGKGFLVKHSDTLFMEQMRLQRKGENWYYILQSDIYADPVAYRLSYYSPDFVVFENKNVAFPNQIVLDKRLGKMCSTVFLPKERIELSPRQLDFWLRRNVVLQDKAVRNLWKQI